MALTKKILDKLPDGLKIRLVSVDDTERRLSELAREGKRKTSRVLNNSPEEIEEYEKIVKEMKWVLNDRYQDGRFKQYFQKQIDSINESIKISLGY